MKDINDYYKYDTHVHTSEVSPCAKIPATKVVDAFIEKGYTGIFISDHFKNSIFDRTNGLTWHERMDEFLLGYKLAKKAGDEKGLKVFLGVEFRLPTKAIVEALAIGISEEILRKYENMDLFPLEKLYEVAEKEGFLLFQAHAFRPKGEVQDSKHLHGYEVINGGMIEEVNESAYCLCVKEDKLPIAGSDFHNTPSVGRAGIYTYEPIKSEKELVQKMREGQYGLFSNKELRKESPFLKDPGFIHLD